MRDTHEYPPYFSLFLRTLQVPLLEVLEEINRLPTVILLETSIVSGMKDWPQLSERKQHDGYGLPLVRSAYYFSRDTEGFAVGAVARPIQETTVETLLQNPPAYRPADIRYSPEDIISWMHKESAFFELRDGYVVLYRNLFTAPVPTPTPL